MDIIVAEELTKKFEELVAVDHVSFRVRKGEVFGFLGPNGAGKTTTINMLITIMRPTEGNAWVAGYSVVDEPEKVRRKIGVVFQDPTLDKELTGRENLWIHGRIYGLSSGELRGKIKELVEFVELGEWMDYQVKKYSGGMMRRLEIARSLLYDPEILFLDEPTLGLDPQTRTHIWGYIEQLRKKRETTIFLTTHYMEEADKLCDRVAIIDHGKIVAVGKAEELKKMVRKEVVYVKIENSASQDLVSELSRLEHVDEVRVLGEKTIGLQTENASETIPWIFKVAQSLNTSIKEINYHRASLEDVFLTLTGRGLRDEKSSYFDHVRAALRSRRLRGH